MNSIEILAATSGFGADELDHWGALISTGSGYSVVLIPQKNRPSRRVLSPSVGLDRVLKQLRFGLEFLVGYDVPDEVHGFVRGRGIVTNAQEHLDQDVVLRIDLSDFFGTISRERVELALQASGFDDECAKSVAGVTTVDESLAPGFSTSPFLSNLLFAGTDLALAALAAEVGVRYTRYADDLVFSGGYEAVNDQLRDAVTAVVTGLGWAVNHRKTRFMRRGKAQFVTGLYVGDSSGPHIPRRMKRLLRREVYFANKFGIDDARSHSPTPMNSDRLGGWVHYAAFADPVVGEQIRSDWRQVAPRSHKPGSEESWDDLLDAIGFPDGW